MNIKLDNINSYVENIKFVQLVEKFQKINEGLIEGKVLLFFDELESALEFRVTITSFYPLRNHEMESINFINEDLIEYPHVMEGGNVCIHTQHCIDIHQKIIIDFNSLKNWITKYYINRDQDDHYEHIILSPTLLHDTYSSYLFLETDYKFNINDFGVSKVSFLSSGIYKGKLINNFLLQSIECSNSKIVEFNWNGIHSKENGHELQNGVFYISKKSPAKFDKFIFDNWLDFEGFFSEDFLKFLYNFEKINIKKHKNKIIPFFIGYYINSKELHWQVILIEIGKFPVEGKPIIKEGIKTRNWKTVITNSKINWSLSRNCSYKYFFGRGTLSDSICNGKILVIGLGAIGSIVSKTLVQGGLKEIDLVDYDTKEPENVCRSEYTFSNGISDKPMEMYKVLSSISPHIKINTLRDDYFNLVTKGMNMQKTKGNNQLEAFLNEYDYIFDCSTDNDLMYVLNSLKLESKLINLSITNHSNSLVCGIHPGIYEFVNHQFNRILDNDMENLYNPTGCWSPTFKANYNDINVLVQYAVKQFNIMTKQKEFFNFTLETEQEECFEIKINKY